MISDSYRFLSTMKEAIEIEPFSQRIKVYQLPDISDIEATMQDLKELGTREGCDKLIFYVKKEERNLLAARNGYPEGVIAGFFRGDDAYIFSMFLNPARNLSLTYEQDRKVMQIVAQDQRESKPFCLPDGYLMRSATVNDAERMAGLYATVFETYPTPMHDPQFIQEMMADHVYFTIVEYAGQIVSASSADLLLAFNAAEMTDCATLPEHRNQGLLSYQFSHLIQHMKHLGVQTLFCYARSESTGMNLINVRNGFTYGGRMVQNSNIDGRLASMNIWFKNL